MLTWWQILIFYSYGLPLFVLNLSTVFMLLIKHQQFAASYYKLFLICAVNDCFLYLFNNLSIRLPLFQPLYDVFYSKLSAFSYYPTIPMFIVVFCSYFTNFSTLLLSLNRLTAVWRYWSHERIWRKAGPFLIAASMLGAFVFSFQTLGNEYLYMHVKIKNVSFVLVQSNNTFKLWDNEIASSAVVGTFTFLGLVVNVLTFILWQKRKQFIPAKHYDMERNLILLTLTIYSLHLMSFVYNTFQDKIFTDLMQIYLAYIVVSDCIALIPTSAILIASNALRSEIFPSCAGSHQIKSKKKARLRGPITVTAVIPTKDFA